MENKDNNTKTAINAFVDELHRFEIADSKYNGISMLEGEESYRKKLQQMMQAFKNEIRAKDACFIERLILDVEEIEREVLKSSEEIPFESLIDCHEMELKSGNKNVEHELNELKFCHAMNETHKEYIQKTKL